MADAIPAQGRPAQAPKTATPAAPAPAPKPPSNVTEVVTSVGSVITVTQH